MVYIHMQDKLQTTYVNNTQDQLQAQDRNRCSQFRSFTVHIF